MRLTFTGDPRGGENPPSVTFGGVEFQLGVAVDVADGVLALRLARNSHFRVGGEPEMAPAVAQPAVRTRRRRPGRPRKVKIDGGDDQNAG
jgi:hypothetical protein